MGLLSPASLLIDQSGIPQNVTVDAFGRVRVSNAPTGIFVKQVFAQDPLFTTTAVTATGTATWSAVGGYDSTLLATPAAADTAAFASRQSHHYQPGKGLLLLATFAAANAGPAPAVTRTVGYSDTTGANQMVLEWGPAGVFWRIRSSRTGWVTESAAQASWNVDPLDGTGPSGITLDLTKVQIIFISAEWLGVGDVYVGFVIHGRFVLCHVFRHANEIAGGVYLSMPNGRLFWRQNNDSGGASGDTLQCVCGAVVSEGGDEVIGAPRTATNGITTKSVSTTLLPLLSIRLKSDRLAQSVIVNAVEVASTANINAEYQVLYNPTLSGVASWLPVDATSAVETDVASTGVSGGLLLAAGYVSQQQREADLPLQFPAIGASLAGVSDVITLAARVISAPAVATLGAIRWIERP